MGGEYQLLVEQAKKKDPQAFTMLYEMLYQDMYRFAVYTLKNAEDAEDAVEDAVADAYASIGKLRDASAFRGWMFKILSIKCKRKLKEYVNRPAALPEELTCAGENITEELQVRQAFFRLDDEERFIVSMRVFGGYDSKEIGAILHKNPNTVRSRLSRALKKMEEYLQE